MRAARLGWMARAPMAVHLVLALQDFTPCELFQRIRGRTLW